MRRCTATAAADRIAVQPAYDDVIQGQSGIAALMAKVAGEPRYAPMTIIADKTCALAIVGAVSRRSVCARTHRPRPIRGDPDVRADGVLRSRRASVRPNFVPPLGELGYTRVLASWRRPYRTKDGYLCMMAYTQAHWHKFWTLVGKPDVHRDPRFDLIASRARNIVALYELAGSCIAGKTTAEWLALLRELEIPAARMASLDEVLADPQLEASGFFKRATHPTEGEILIPICRCALAIPR